MNTILTDNEFISAAQSLDWTFAKTMPEAPHEYIVRDKLFDDDTYVALFNTIEARGVPGDWKGTQYKYLRPGDGHKYWKMTDDIEKSVIINRAYDNFDKYFLKKSLRMSIGETDITFCINDPDRYKKSEFKGDEWFDWCLVSIIIKSRYFNFDRINDELLTVGEVKALYQYLDGLLKGKVTDIYRLCFIEPDLEFILYPKYKFSTPGVIKERDRPVLYDTQDISVAMNIYLAETEGYNGQAYSIRLNSNDVDKFKKYLFERLKALSNERYGDLSSNINHYEHGNRIRLIDHNNNVFEGYIIDTFLAEDCTDLMKQEDGISILSDDGRSISFYQSEIKSMERLIYQYVHNEIICTKADETVYRKQCEIIENHLSGIKKQKELHYIDNTLLQQYTYNEKRIIVINNTAAGQVQLKSEVPLDENVIKQKYHNNRKNDIKTNRMFNEAQQ